MNKTAIKNFAVWARRKLISKITYKAGLLGITEQGIANPVPQSTKDMQFFDVGTKEYTSVSGNEIMQRNSLVAHIKEKERSSDYKTAFQTVVEEVAYTWFNRLIAIRFMEVNDYLPSRIRVLSSENPAKLEPDFVTAPFDTDLEFSAYERDRVMQLKDENKLDELFRMLFIKQCNKLNDNLPELFEKTDDYTELLLTISFTDNDGVVYHLVHDIDEDDFNIEKEGQVEIIGWLYQAYIIEVNEMVYDGSFAKVKISKELLPAATQLFTPDWSIRYMIENSLGRLWLEGHPNDSLKSKWKYYLDEEQQRPDVKAQLDKIREEYQLINPEDIKVIDPCMGSGHILVYAFNVLMQIYESYGYTGRDAANLIVEKNLYGLDIDDRAYQFAYFAVMMKGREYDRSFLTKDIKPNLCAVKESNGLNCFEYDAGQLKLDDYYKEIANYLIDSFKDAKEYGSILNIKPRDYDGLMNYIEKLKSEGAEDLFVSAWINNKSEVIPILIKQAKIMAQKYDVVITNPPYLGSSRFSPKLGEYVNNNFPTVKSDLSMVIFKHSLNTLAKKNRFVSFITTSSWMFLKSFEAIRHEVLETYQIESICDFGTELFDGKVGHNPIVAWVNRTSKPIKQKKITAIRLVDYCYSKREEKPLEFFNPSNRYHSLQENFAKIPGMPIAYWVSQSFVNNFSKGKLSDLYFSGGRNKTHNNEQYLRLWWEIDNREKWQSYDKGGDFRCWYGNHEYVVNWSEEAKREYDSHGGLYNQDYANKEGICWTLITSAKTGFRIKPSTHHYDSGSPVIFNNNFQMDKYVLAFLNTKVAYNYLNLLNPTINMGNTYVLSLPLIYQKSNLINNMVQQNLTISESDWDSFETSWDFERHPFLKWLASAKLYGEDEIQEYLIEDSFELWKTNAEYQFNKLKANEEELNRIFIEIYGLQDELTPEIEDKDVTIRKADLLRDIRSFISYAVGCMFGRYSPLKDGLLFAGGEWNYDKITKDLFDAIGKNEYTQTHSEGSLDFIDEDNCIPITDEEYFKDDIVGKFVEFVGEVYGSESLEENLDFIANALGNKGDTSREVIRNYFIKDFYKDHCKIYQKRPIYWLFDSGKEDGFKALIYMHRYNADTIGTLRIEYLHKIQKVYESEISRMQETIDNSTNAREVTAAEKRKEKLVKQLKETKDYDAKIAHLALARIEIDLDDGVKVNYEKIQTCTDGKKLEVLEKI